MTVDTKKLEQFLGQFLNDLGATVHAGMIVIGDHKPLCSSGFCRQPARCQRRRRKSLSRIIRRPRIVPNE
jgi:hypothetical protein